MKFKDKAIYTVWVIGLIATSPIWIAIDWIREKYRHVGK